MSLVILREILREVKRQAPPTPDDETNIEVADILERILEGEPLSIEKKFPDITNPFLQFNFDPGRTFTSADRRVHRTLHGIRQSDFRRRWKEVLQIGVQILGYELRHEDRRRNSS
jgi:phage terminase Nu1 subunit (DNA packaging protein)